jgi:regulator of sigma E protease
MHVALTPAPMTLGFLEAAGEWAWTVFLLLKVVIGFSIIIFVHELGHFLAAKWMGVRVDRFAIGFFYRLVGWRKGEGITFGPKPTYDASEIKEKGYGETDYCLNAFPFGGYVKMLGENDILVDEETGEIKTSDDPRAFNNKPVGRRMVVVSAGVVFNVAFAILLYAFVYLSLGKDVAAPVIGSVQAGTPGAAAGLLPGDRVLSINGEPVHSFEDIVAERVLSAGPATFRIARDGKPLDRDFVVGRSTDTIEGLPSDLIPMLSTEFDPRIEINSPGIKLKPGDTVTEVNGKPVDSAYEIVTAFRDCGGDPVALTVARPDPETHQTHTVTIEQPPVLVVKPPLMIDSEGRPSAGVQHILGLRQRQCVAAFPPSSAARDAGFKIGDAIVQWGSIANPIFREITESVQASRGRPIPVVVERDGKLIDLEVAPRRRFTLFGDAPFRAGISFNGCDGKPIVADVVQDTPAARLGMPRGALLVTIAEKPVANWFDVIEQLLTHAGQTVPVEYQTGNDRIAVPLTIPGSVVNALNLPPTVRITKIDGVDTVTLESGQTARLPEPFAIRKLLESRIGQTVTITYASGILDPTVHTGSFAVTADNYDPWQLRLGYSFELWRLFVPLKEKVGAGGNPIRAAWMGLGQTGKELQRVYAIVKRMVGDAFSEKESAVSVQNVSGPIGIVRSAVRIAEVGMGDLMFFMAFISVNLAVINFLPLPVVDGGHMVFLLLEKVRGRPLNLKVQVITTLVGLGLIVLCFVFVTFQDIMKWWDGSL